MAKVDVAELEKVKTEIEKRSNGVCPDAQYCANYMENCKLKKDCFPFAKNEAASFLFVWALGKMVRGEMVHYYDSSFALIKEIYLRDGGDESRIEAIVDTAYESSERRKRL